MTFGRAAACQPAVGDKAMSPSKEPTPLTEHEPQLDHNRKLSDRLLRMKRRSLAATVVLGFMMAVILPVDVLPTAAMGLLVGAVALFSYFEIRRVAIFRRDLKERRRSG